MATCSGCSETSKYSRPEGMITGARRLFLALLLLPLAGCAGVQPQGPPGGLVHTDEVTRLFEAGAVPPDHGYYYCGPEAEPDAIIGIRTGFTLQGHYWQQVDLTPKQLSDWNRRIDNAHRISFAYKGARIMTPDGREAGVWYSKYEHTVIRFPDAATILIYTPTTPPVGGFPQDGLEDRDLSGRGPKR